MFFLVRLLYVSWRSGAGDALQEEVGAHARAGRLRGGVEVLHHILTYGGRHIGIVATACDRIQHLAERHFFCCAISLRASQNVSSRLTLVFLPATTTERLMIAEFITVPVVIWRFELQSP